jgi:flagellar biosynthetic protein FlhB
MAGQEQDQEANEPATPFKLQKAHERGSIVRSSDVTFASVMFACVGVAYGLGNRIVQDVAQLMHHGLLLASRNEPSAVAVSGYMGGLSVYALGVIAPAVLTVWICALLVAGAQARGVFSAQPLKPDFSRLNPANGVERLFSIRSLHELWRSVAKMLVIAAAMGVWLRHHLREILLLSRRGHAEAAHRGIELLGSVLSLLAIIMLGFALLDWLINHREYMRKMRMSKREIRDEHKEREGDPRIKRRLRQLRIEWLKRSRQIAKVRSADVVLTNPTHYAVALEYRHGEMAAPMITARGAGELAQRMRTEALRHRVPVVENAPLTRALYALKESQVFVPEEHFDPVARVLRWVYAARARRGPTPEAAA